jgi:hypothetical protein
MMKKHENIKTANLKRNNQYYWYTNIMTKLVSVLLFIMSLGICLASQSVLAISNHRNNYEESVTDLLDKGDLAEFFDLGTGIFATILFALSLIAYKRIKSRRILYVAIAFAIFAIRVIVSNLDLFIPEIESSGLELLLAVMGFAALGLFFFAIVRREKIKTRTMH